MDAAARSRMSKAGRRSSEAPSKRVFIDRQMMAEKAQDPVFKMEDIYKDSGFCQRVARSEGFETLTMCIIASNTLWISLELDLNHEEVLLQAHPAFIIVENFFCFFFTGELVIRFGAYAKSTHALRDRGFMFDFILVLLLVLEDWVLMLVYRANSKVSSNSFFGDASIARSLRLLRLLRAARVARLLRMVPEVVIILKGMSAAFRSVMLTLLLLVILTYMFAIILRQLADGTSVGENWFPNVPATASQLVVKALFFDDIGDLSNDIAHHTCWPLAVAMFAVFYTFMILGCQTLLNMLIGVLCDVVATVAVVEREENMLCQLKDYMWPFVLEIAGQAPREDEMKTFKDEVSLTRAQFLEILTHPEAAVLLQSSKVDLFALVDHVDISFTDDLGKEKKLGFRDLIQVFMEHRQTNHATARDISDLRHHLNHQMDVLDTVIRDRVLKAQASIEALTQLVGQIFHLSPEMVEALIVQKAELLKTTADNFHVKRGPSTNVSQRGVDMARLQLRKPVVRGCDSGCDPPSSRKLAAAGRRQARGEAAEALAAGIDDDAARPSVMRVGWTRVPSAKPSGVELDAAASNVELRMVQDASVHTTDDAYLERSFTLKRSEDIFDSDSCPTAPALRNRKSMKRKAMRQKPPSPRESTVAVSFEPGEAASQAAPAVASRGTPPSPTSPLIAFAVDSENSAKSFREARARHKARKKKKAAASKSQLLVSDG